MIPLKKYTLIAFDVDDTLIATFENGFKKFCCIAESLHAPTPSYEIYKKCYGVYSFEECVKKLFPISYNEEVIRQYNALAPKFPDIVFDDVLPCLNFLHDSGFILAIVTNGPRDKTERKLRSIGFSTKKFSAIVCGDDMEKKKPDPISFQPLLERLQEPVSSTLYIGDSIADYIATKSLGIKFLRISRNDGPSFFDHAEGNQPQADEINSLCKLIEESW